MTYNGEVVNGSVIIKVHSSKDSPPINEIFVYGLKDGKEVQVAKWNRDILAPSEKIEIEIPLKRITKSQNYNNPTKEIGELLITEGKLPVSEMVDTDKSLSYRLKCDNCRNNEEWSQIRNRLTFNWNLIIGQKCEDVPENPKIKKCWNSVEGVEYDLYEWA